MSIDDLLRKGRRQEQADLTALNARVLNALQEDGVPENIFTRIMSVVLQSPMLALTAVGLMVLLPLHGIISTWGLAEPVYGYILERLIR